MVTWECTTSSKFEWKKIFRDASVESTLNLHDRITKCIDPKEPDLVNLCDLLGKLKMNLKIDYLDHKILYYIYII